MIVNADMVQRKRMCLFVKAEQKEMLQKEISKFSIKPNYKYAKGNSHSTWEVFIACTFYFSESYSLCGHYAVKSFTEVITLCYLQTKFG